MGDRIWLTFGARATAAVPTSAQQQIPSSSKQADKDTDKCDGFDSHRVSTPAQRSLQRSLTQVPVQQPVSKVPRLVKISSYIGLGSAAKDQHPTTSTTPELVMHHSDPMDPRSISRLETISGTTATVSRDVSPTESDIIFKESDRTWYQPTLQQMTETVGCAIMTNGICEPIPRHLNGYVAGMIEEIRILLSQTKKIQAEFQELRQTRDEEAQQFTAMTEEWKARENDFKAEINRLEHIVAVTQRGAESVMMARAGSVCDRNGSHAFEAALGRLSKNEDDMLNRGESSPRETRDDVRNSATFMLDENLVSQANGTKLRASFQQDLGDDIDHNADVLLSQQLLDKELTANLIERLKAKHDREQQMSAELQRINITSPSRPPSTTSLKKPSPRKSVSSAATSSRSIIKSSPPASLITEGLVTERAAHEVLTPHTTPPHTATAQKAQGNPFNAIQELIRENGGLPEDAIDDSESSYAPSFANLPSRDPPGNGSGKDPRVRTQPPTSEALKSAPSSKVRSQVPDICQDSSNCAKIEQEGNGSSLSRSSSGSQGSQRSNSSILMSMGRNLVEERRKNADMNIEGSPGSNASSRANSSTRSTPTRQRQSGSDPFPDEATKYEYRHTRLITNAHIRARSFLKDEELVAMAIDETLRPGVGLPAEAFRHHKPMPARLPLVRGPRRELRQPGNGQPATRNGPGQNKHVSRPRPGFDHAATRVVRPPPGFEHIIPQARRPVGPPPGFEVIIPAQQNHETGAGAAVVDE